MASARIRAEIAPTMVQPVPGLMCALGAGIPRRRRSATCLSRVNHAKSLRDFAHRSLFALPAALIHTADVGPAASLRQYTRCQMKSLRDFSHTGSGEWSGGGQRFSRMPLPAGGA